jgi:hypothetical protein
MKMKMTLQSSSGQAAPQAQKASQASSSCPPLPSELLFHDQNHNKTLLAMNSGPAEQYVTTSDAALHGYTPKA